MSLVVRESAPSRRETEPVSNGKIRLLLARERRRYHNLFSLAAEALVETDVQGRILSANAAASLLFGMPPRCLRGGVLSALVTRADVRSFLDLLLRIQRGEGPARTTLTMKRRRAESFAAEVRAVSHESESGPAVLWSLCDTSAAPSAANGQAAPERLVHELRTPLMPALLAASMLEADNPPPQVRQSAELIRRNIELLTCLIGDFFAPTLGAHGARLNVEDVDLHRLLGDVVVLYQSEIRARRLDLRTELEARRHVVGGDSVRMRQLFWNVLREAVRSTPPESALRLCSHEMTDDRISVALEIDGAGPFRPNLDVARQLAEAHEGTVWAESDECGSRIIVDLPLSEDVPDGGRRPNSLVRRRVLVVDKHEDSAITLARFLRRNGQHAAVAHSVAEAMRLARHHRFDVLICGLLLPDGSGYELLSRLRELGPLAAVALSALGSEDDFERSERAGFARHLIKPIAPSQMLAALADLGGLPASALDGQDSS